MTRRSISLMIAAAGLVLGVLLSFIGPAMSQVSDQMLLGAFALVVLLVSASLTSSARAGLILAVFTLLSNNVTDFVYFGLAYGADLSLLPYAVGFILFLGRIPVFPLAGALGGYLGQEYFTRNGKVKRLREKGRKRKPRT